MDRVHVLVAVCALTAALVAAPGVAAQEGGSGISIGVSVGEEEYADGDRVEVDEDALVVNVTVRSENELNVIESSLHDRSIIRGVTGTSYNTSHVLETSAGPNYYRVVVEDSEGNIGSHTVNFYKQPATARELRNVVERLQERSERLEDEIDRLEERRQELNETRRDLRERLNRTRADGGGNGTDAEGDAGPEPLSGFGFVVAALAVALVGAYRRQ